MFDIDSAQSEILLLFEGIPATYAQGESTINDVLVVPGRFGTRVSTQKERVDVPLPRQELLIGSASLGAIRPERGDSVTVDFGLGPRVYRVAPEENERTWEPSDPAGILLRVRCVLES